MADPKKLITKESRLHNARQFIESISEPANTAYYTFIGNHLEYANTSDIPQPNDSVSDTHIDVYRNMLYGKRIASGDVKLMIVRNDYTSNAVYSMYDDKSGESNISFFDSNYYAVVNADAFYHVFKVLDNNNGLPSTVQPEFSEVDATDEIYQTSDGYVWKYMYSVDDTTVRKFATSEFFPVVANSIVSSAAKEGIINVIKVENAGRGYDNYCNGTFRIEDLRISGNSYVYSINASQSANTTSKFYRDCYLYVTAGTGAGQYSKIDDYVVNSSMKAIHIKTPFQIPLMADSVYEISPGVEIIGDGTETIKAEARAIVNSSGNVIQRIEMLNLGENYKFASARVLADPVVGISNTASIRPVYSPPGGHGFDAASELGATRICISTKLSNSDVGIPKSNDYRTFGLLRDPKFANVTVTYSNANGTFIADEKFYKVRGVKIEDGATVDTASAVLTAPADFENQLSAGEYIYLKTADGYSLAVVNSVVNSSYITLTQNSVYSCTATAVYKTNIETTISNVNLSYTSLTGTVSVNTTSANMNGSGTSFLSQLIPNSSHVFVYANSSGGGVLKKVVSVIDDTHAVLESNCAFANTTAKAQIIGYSITPSTSAGIGSSEGTITSIAVGSFIAANVSGVLSTGDTIIGERSGAFATVDTIYRSGVAKDFSTFVQMQKYSVSSVDGAFIPDEVVFQSETGLIADQYANANFHSYVNDGVDVNYFMTNQIGVFNSGQRFIGVESSATANVVNKYSPEIEFGSGKVMYIENVDSINRSNTATEIIKFIFEF